MFEDELYSLNAALEQASLLPRVVLSNRIVRLRRLARTLRDLLVDELSR